MKLFSKKSSAHSHGHEIHEGMSNIGHDPFIDWLFILVMGSVVVIALVAAGFLSYKKVGNILSAPPTEATSSASSAIDPGMLAHVLKQYEVRAQERAEIIKAYKGPADPSL
jgi:hypothetical protein